jgi:hypothetical protein
LTFNGLHGIISQKIVFFTTTAVRTSNPPWQNNQGPYLSLLDKQEGLVSLLFLLNMVRSPHSNSAENFSSGKNLQRGRDKRWSMMSNNTFPVRNMCSDLKHLNPRKVSVMIVLRLRVG